MRTFVAIEISDNNIINSIEKFQKELKINAKPVNQVLKTINFSSFDVNLKGIGVFPKLKFPRIVWIGTDEDGGNKLVDLAQKIEELLKPLGFSSDKAFKPHITVFRIKKKGEDITRQMENNKNMNFGIQKITSIKLKKSELTPNGPIYSDLVEISAIK